MTDYLLMAIIALLALNLLINLSAWSRRSATYNQLAHWTRTRARALRQWRARGRRKHEIS